MIRTPSRPSDHVYTQFLTHTKYFDIPTQNSGPQDSCLSKTQIRKKETQFCPGNPPYHTENQTMEFTIQPSTLADTPSLVEVNKAAFHSTTHEHMFPKDREHLTPPEELQAWRLKRMAGAITRNGPEDHYFNVTPVDRPDLIVGYAHWHGPGHYAKEENNEMERNEDSGIEFPACMNVELMRECMRQEERLRKEIMGGTSSNYWCTFAHVSCFLTSIL